MRVTTGRLEDWLVRAILMVALAAPAVLWAVARGLENQVYAVELEFASSVDGVVQMFYDTGAGFNEAESVGVAVRAGDRPQPVRLLMPHGTYREFRIDPPGRAGRFTIAGAQVQDSLREVLVDIPAPALVPAVQLARVASPPSAAVFESPPGSNDPQITWTPAAPLVLPRTWPRLPAAIAGSFVAAFALVMVLECLLAPFGPTMRRALTACADRGGRHPRTAIALAATVGTLLAMYPVVFLGRSLVSPSNGPVVLLYDVPPWAPGHRDSGIEDVRESDVHALVLQLVPYTHIQRQALAQGELPLWNRYSGVGRPLWGQGQTAILDPLHWPTLVVPDLALGWDVKFVLHRFVFALGVGMAVLALTAAWPAAASAALLAPFVSFFLFRLSHPSQFAFTYAAWVMWAWFRLAPAATRRDLARAGAWLAIASTLMVVASPPKEAFVILLCGWTTGVLACLLQRQGWLLLSRRLGTALLAGIVTVLLSAPHWLIFVSTLAQSATLYDTPAARFATWRFVDSLVFGALYPGELSPGTHVVVFAAVVAAILAGRATWTRGSRTAVVIGPLLAIAVAFGAVPERVIVALPFVSNIYQIDFAFTGAGVLLLCIAAGAGIAALLDHRVDHRVDGMRAAVISAAACAAGGVLLLFASGGAAADTRHVETWALCFSVVLAALLVLTTRVAAIRWPAPRSTLAVVLVTLMLVAPSGLHATFGVPRVDALAIQPHERGPLERGSPVTDAIHRDMSSPTRAVGLNHVMYSGSQALYGLEGIAGSDALALRRSEQLIDASGIERISWMPMVRARELSRLAPLFDLLNVGYLLSDPGDASQTIPPETANVTPLPTSGADILVASRRTTAWPRAFFVDAVVEYSGADGFMTLLNASKGPFAAIERGDAQAASLVPDDASAEGPARRATGTETPAGAPTGRVVVGADYALTTNRTRFRVHAPGPGVAVLTEAWMADDFVATLNGAPTPYFRVNHAFKGMRIPAAGDWTIEFRYRPALWSLSLALAAVGVLGLAAFGLAINRSAAP